MGRMRCGESHILAVPQAFGRCAMLARGLLGLTQELMRTWTSHWADAEGVPSPEVVPVVAIASHGRWVRASPPGRA